MKDSEGIAFLQWCLPQLHLRWEGFRKVRRQIFRRLDRHLRELDIANVKSYQSYLESHSEEWSVLLSLCQITISRFYRDKGVFKFLEHDALPALAVQVLARKEGTLRFWSIGCASGEEPYTLAIMWACCLAPLYPQLHCEIVGTDVNLDVIARARQARYPASSVKDLPPSWVELGFDSLDKHYRLKEELQKLVSFSVQDIRKEAPDSTFHLILCRYLVFTYFDEASQREMLQKIWGKLFPGGMLVIGNTENLPQKETGFEPLRENIKVFRKSVEYPK